MPRVGFHWPVRIALALAVVVAQVDPTNVEHWVFEEQMALRPRVAVFAIKQLDYFELVVATMGAFPPSLQAEWRDCVRSLLERSHYVRRVLLDVVGAARAAACYPRLFGGLRIQGPREQPVHH